MLTVILVAAATFGVIYLIDRGFTKIFRSQEQHQSGLAVRLRKGYGVAGVLLSVLAALALLQVTREFDGLLLAAGLLLLAGGIALVVYYLSFGIFYDSESFVLTTFGKKSTTYRYADIANQQLYSSAGGILIELWMGDGRNVGLQATMDGVYPFLDQACHARFRQLGINSAECAWFDPDNSVWFPPKED